MTVSTAIDRAKRELKIAGALFREGLMPECDASMRRALQAALEASASQSEDPSPESRAHAALEVLAKQGYGDVEPLRAVLAEEPPAGAAESSRLRSDFEKVWAETERVVRFAARRLEPEATRRQRRRVAAALAALLIVVGVFLVERLWGGVRARASASYSPDSPAAYAVDGIDTTEWLLPDGQRGWLDVYLPRPKDITGILVLNGHNRFYLDRATRQVRVTAYADHRELGSAEGEFAAIKDGTSALKLALRAQGVTRVRIEVLSFFGAGGTIAEVEVR